MIEIDLIERVKRYLIQKYNCHTIILYGSYSSGDFTNESDLDFVCFSDINEDKIDIESFEGIQLDVRIFNTEKMENPEYFLYVCTGKILLNELGFAEKFMMEIKKLFTKGPKKLSHEEKKFLKVWLKKMFLRSNKGDIEGNYRYHWMLTDCLEIYFSLKDLWYLGPKKAFNWLQVNDEVAYKYFNHALAKDAKRGDIEVLLDFLYRM